MSSTSTSDDVAGNSNVVAPATPSNVVAPLTTPESKASVVKSATARKPYLFGEARHSSGRRHKYHTRSCVANALKRKLKFGNDGDDDSSENSGKKVDKKSSSSE